MLFIRSLLFNIFLPVWTIIVSVLFFPMALCVSPKTITMIVGRVWSIGMLFGLRVLCGIKHEIRGKENLPKGSFIIASKHQSAWETIVFLSIIDYPIYILKQELLKLPFYGTYLRNMEMIAVDRSGGSSALKKMLADVKNRLSQNRPVIIFPEGTRVAVGTTVKYHPGIALIYQEKDMDFPIIPVALNSGLFWARNAFIKRPGIITMEYLPAIEKGLDRKDFINKLQYIIDTKSDELCNLAK